LTRFPPGVNVGVCGFASSSNEQTEFVGEDSRVSGVAARERQLELELMDELTEPVRVLVTIETSAVSISAAARSKCVLACWSKLFRDGEIGGRVLAQSSMEVAA
jgi:hypothetical protein